MFAYDVYKLFFYLHLISEKRFTRLTKKYTREYFIIANSSLFDKTWYLNYYPEVKNSHLDPVEHYLKYGWMEGKNPSEKFNGNVYLNMYQDVQTAVMNPLLHYELYGKGKKRKIYKFFPPVSIEQTGTHKTGVIYTCITGGYDNLIQHTCTNNNFDYICFTDNADMIKKGKVGIWTIMPLQFNKCDNIRNARWHKTHPHTLFKDKYEYSMWVDANVDIRSRKIFEIVDRKIKEGVIFASPRHPLRHCVYEEADAVKRLKKDTTHFVDDEVKFLKENNYPANNGLYETSIVLRNHRNQICEKTMDCWWDMIANFSCRDQLGVNFALWKNKCPNEFLLKEDLWRNENGALPSIFKHNGKHKIVSPGDMFFGAGYLEMYPDVAKSGMDPWKHYAEFGKKEGRDNGLHPWEKMFFGRGYLVMYPDVAKAGLDPWKHYVEHGKKEGRDNGLHPKENQFFGAGYLEMYPDIAKAGMDPWKHYVKFGKKEGRDNGKHPKEDQFFGAGYLVMYPDVAKAKLEPWRHYVKFGKKEGRDNGLHPRENQFFGAGYLEMYQDVAKAKIDPWKHYVKFGKKEGRDNGKHPKENQFSAAGYLEMYPDVAKAKIDPWHHYVKYGKKEGLDNGMHPKNERAVTTAGYQGHSEIKKSGADSLKPKAASDKTENKREEWTDYSILLAGHKGRSILPVCLSTNKVNNPYSKDSKKILLIGHEFSVSGAALSLRDIAELLVSSGYSVDIAVRNVRQGDAIHLYDGLGADVFLIPESVEECFANADKVVRNYDLVIVNTLVMGIYAELCRKLNIPHFWFVREPLSSIRNCFNSDGLCRQRFFDDCSNVLLESEYAAGCVYNEYNLKCRFINNFIKDRLSAFSPANVHPRLGKVRTFAVIGSIEKRKAQEAAVAAFLYLSAVPQYKDEWKLLLIGKNGSDSPEPLLSAKLESVTKNVPGIVWCGAVTEKNKWELFNSIDFFIVPSMEASSSRVAIEAAMMGKPVMVTSHVGEKYLTDNKAGFVFEPGNAVALRDVVIKCLNMSQSMYTRMSHQIRLNYEAKSSPEIYRQSLLSAIAETYEKCHPVSEMVKAPGVAGMTFRTLAPGRNVISLSQFEYIKFVDFSHLEKIEAKDVSASENCEKSVGVVVPVYNGLEHLNILVPSLFKNTDLPHKFVFVDDCSSADTTDFLSEVTRGRDDCILVRNEHNLGFVKSINRGAAKALEYCDNFVMLNSDTEVPSGWLSRLMKPIFEDEKIASVTPLSNRCNIFSFPFFEKRERNDLFLHEFGLEGINEAIRKSSVDPYIDLPTGHGFCMGISGKVWKKIGGLNEALFGRGYGEENEWSFRAELDGYKHIQIQNLYVAHHERGSFTMEEKKSNCVTSKEILSVMFPGYQAHVNDFVSEHPSSDSFVSIYLSLARQRGYSPETFTDCSLFMTRMSGDDGILVLLTPSVTKIAVKILGETIFVGNAIGIEKSGIFDA